MLHRVEVRTSVVNTAIVIPFSETFNLSTGRFYVRYIDGLGPPDINVSTTTIPNSNKSVYQGANPNPRNIVLTLGYIPNPRYTIEESRELLYRYFAPGGGVNLRFVRTDGISMEIVGYTETVVAPIFSEDPAIQISVLCPDPMFYATSQITEGSAGIATSIVVPIAGQMVVGAIFTLTNTHSTATLTRIGVRGSSSNYHGLGTTSNASSIFSGLSIGPGGRLVINTIPGERSATEYVTSSSSGTNALRKLEDGSSWAQLDGGRSNVITILNRTPSTIYPHLEVKYTPKYTGV